MAAEDPPAAVAALFDAVVGRELGRLDGVVCERRQKAMRRAFGDRALGLDLMAESLGDLTLSADDLHVEILEETAERASAQVSGSLAIAVDEAGLRDLVRDVIEVGAGPGDPPVTEAEIDATVPLLDDALGLDLLIEGVLTLVVEDGEWVVCGSFDGLVVGLDELYGTEPIVSTGGLCALATPAELSALSALEYDSSTDYDESCTYSGSDWDHYHTTTALLALGTTLDDWRELAVPDRDLRVGGAAAFSSDGTVFTEADASVLQVSVSLPPGPPADVDAVSQAIAVSELLLPRLEQLAADEMGAEPEPAGLSLCDVLTLDELNTASGRGFDRAEGDAAHCAWTSSDPAAALDAITATVTGLTLDEFGEIVGATEAIDIGGMPAISTPTRAVIELSDGQTLDVSVYYDERAEPTYPADLLALMLVERLARALAAEPPAAGDGVPDSSD